MGRKKPNVPRAGVKRGGKIGSIRFWALKIGMSHTTLNYRLKTHGEDNLIQFIKSKLK